MNDFRAIYRILKIHENPAMQRCAGLALGAADRIL